MSGSTELLKLLGSSARIGLGRGGPGLPTGGAGIEHADFSAMLKKAQTGAIASQLPVTIESGANVALTDEELAGLSLVADRAEAAGVRTALVMFPDKSVVLDVHTRQVKSAADVNSDVLTGVDGVVRIPAAGPAGATGVVPTLPAGAIGNASVARLLGTIGPSTPQDALAKAS
jgi:hypothetical protein